MNILEFSLFIIDIIKIKRNETYLDYGFNNLINSFIYKCHEENPNLISIIFDIELLDELAVNNTELVSLQTIIGIINKYSNIDNYLKLLEEIDFEEAAKINELALMFLKFRQDYYEEYSILMSPPQVRILQ